ncbi:Uu.00g127640.m01.CDS01 [Anthostomella pinea]|uniref:Uu.00g127640.m01.CDS01 n=1 Tax=Anthostomella pinea TaxID=933095 RepID=A0AAI8YHT4_9PEZI|nr:Uu.00g127640.m01.CDS01 [Anthostomella pinea]
MSTLCFAPGRAWYRRTKAAKYEYRPLERPTDVRLVTILPGNFGDSIRIEIAHAPLDAAAREEPKRLSIKEIQETLPKKWDAYEALEGRVLFEDGNSCTTWDHLDPDLSCDAYDPVTTDNHGDSVPAYEALSYTWGSPEKMDTAMVENIAKRRDSFSGPLGIATGVSRAPSLNITRNLSEALRHLRKPDQRRTLWIDAISINQNDFQERSDQVARMGLVYSLASRVVAWLGPSFRDTRLAFSVLDTIGIHEMLFDFHTRACADDRDKVYGLMNLAHPAVSKRIRVDYSRSPLEAFQQIILAALEQEKRLAQLPLSGLRHSAPRWPSWVSDWSQTVPLTVPTNLGFYASGVSAARARHIPPAKLEVTGRYFVTMSSVIGRVSGGLSDIVRLLKDMGVERLKCSRYLTGETQWNAYLQTLTLNRTDNRLAHQEYPTLHALSEEVTRMAYAPESKLETTLPGYYVDLVENWSKGSLLFATYSGHIGIIDGAGQPGDEVFVVLGCNIPMRLRPCRTGEYAVVGDCYVHGIMDGEALLGAVSSHWSFRVVQEPDGEIRAYYRNTDTGVKTTDDPRLAGIPLPPEWEPMKREWTRADPVGCRWFRNTQTGKIVNSDPRLFPETLIDRGVELRTITLL